jgi:hypothetical protein
MPTVLTWTYWGEHQVDEENGDVQRIKPGGIADDDQLGEVTIISLDTGIFTVETGTTGADGKHVQTRRTAGHIRARVSEPAAFNRISPTGRPGQQKGAQNGASYVQRSMGSNSAFRACMRDTRFASSVFHVPSHHMVSGGYAKRST